MEIGERRKRRRGRRRRRRRRRRSRKSGEKNRKTRNYLCFETRETFSPDVSGVEAELRPPGVLTVESARAVDC